MTAWKKFEFVMLSNYPAHTSVTSSRSATILLLGTRSCPVTYTPDSKFAMLHSGNWHTEVDHLRNISVLGQGYAIERINEHAMKAGRNTWICSISKVTQQPVSRIHDELFINCNQCLLTSARYLFRFEVHSLRSVASISCLLDLLLFLQHSQGEAL
jgi:hypothetical protein